MVRRISRREFIRICTGTTAGIALLSALEPYILETLAEAAEGKPPVIWLQGAGCTGCSVSLLNAVNPPIQKVLLDIISLRFHPTVMGAAGHLAWHALEETAAKYPGKYFLVVEGGVPTGDDGIYCTIGEKDGKEITLLHALKEYGSKAAAIIAAGQCASFGGIPAAAPNPTTTVGVWEVVEKTPVINVPCCPMHPDDFLGTVTYVLRFGELPELDYFNRPKLFFPEQTIHEGCPRCEYFAKGIFAKHPGDEGCLAMVGCKGMVAHSRCHVRWWNNHTNWCIRAGAPCQACSEPGFPDDSGPLYGRYRLHE
ncbi:hydrogenase (NiFe) small subunit HydA [Ammonifex degensii KC4]|uniref:Hydrogenase (NiFe) small subunit HydA n=1 Tax=Ammonifex degensii (strain DSM 10501 / KC4) TaxID=429009 RepID=C9R7R4_AMMDK|nr:hydrogenase (NiFe) small subunit HydA [Ammonifex degensii KC4]